MSEPSPGTPASLRRTHLRWGWSALATFVAMGLVLESLHGFKVGAYLDVDHETRRLMWRLAHAHGTLIALVQLAFASSLGDEAKVGGRPGRGASLALRVAQVALPLGFFLGGLWHHGGDPGLGILLVPVGAVALLWGVASIAAAQWRK